MLATMAPTIRILDWSGNTDWTGKLTDGNFVTDFDCCNFWTNSGYNSSRLMSFITDVHYRDTQTSFWQLRDTQLK